MTGFGGALHGVKGSWVRVTSSVSEWTRDHPPERCPGLGRPRPIAGGWNEGFEARDGSPQLHVLWRRWTGRR